MADYRTRQWHNDVATYSRYRELLDSTTTERARATIQNRMAELQSRWPYHRLGE